jgi:IS5 family transposase
MALSFRFGDLLSDNKWLKPLAAGATVQLGADGKNLQYKMTLDYHVSSLIPGIVGKMLDDLYLPIFPTAWIDEKGKFRVGISVLQH